MSNSSSSPVVLRIQQSAVVFVVLLLALGALVLAANNIDPNASVRGDVRYTLWKSPDGMFSLEYPVGWSVKQLSNTPPQYQVAPDDGSAMGSFGLVNISSLKVTDADKNPQNALNQVVQTRNPSPPINAHPIYVDGISGYAGTVETHNTDPTTQEDETQETIVSLVPLDGSHVVLTSMSSNGTTSTTVPSLWDHIMNTLLINKPAALRALGVGVPTATPTTAPTQAATEVATGAATQAATSAATAAATAAP